MDLNSKLLPDLEDLYDNPRRYRKLGRKLNYLTINRPDISCVIGIVIFSLRILIWVEHWIVMIRVGVQRDMELGAYSDIDWA